jgi:hypothetical protein
MEEINLFSTKIYKTHIDKNLYNHEELINTIEENYSIDSVRSDISDFETNSHNYYNDWNNPKFKKINLEEIEKIYGQKTHEFIDTLDIVIGNWKAFIVNVHASMPGQGIKPHGHLPAFYSSVHYLKLDDDHDKIIFHSPLTINQFASSIYDMSKIKNNLNATNFFSGWEFEIKEGDMIFFPSYLMHEVAGESKSNSLRISVASNIHI